MKRKTLLLALGLSTALCMAIAAQRSATIHPIYIPETPERRDWLHGLVMGNIIVDTNSISITNAAFSTNWPGLYIKAYELGLREDGVVTWRGNK